MTGVLMNESTGFYFFLFIFFFYLINFMVPGEQGHGHLHSESRGRIDSATAICSIRRSESSCYRCTALTTTQLYTLHGTRYLDLITKLHNQLGPEKSTIAKRCTWTIRNPTRLDLRWLLNFGGHGPEVCHCQVPVDPEPWDWPNLSGWDIVLRNDGLCSPQDQRTGVWVGWSQGL